VIDLPDYAAEYMADSIVSISSELYHLFSFRCGDLGSMRYFETMSDLNGE
jgi:hypothetical protein